MPDNAPITGFCAHVGQHIEGMDHVWIPIKKGVPAKSLGAGTIMSIDKHADTEYFIYVDYGDGLSVAYGEINKPLVEVGQHVEHLDPIGEVNDFSSFDAGEIEIIVQTQIETMVSSHLPWVQKDRQFHRLIILMKQRRNFSLNLILKKLLDPIRQGKLKLTDGSQVNLILLTG